MLVEVIKRPYKRHKVGAQIELKAKDARILIILKRVKPVVESAEESNLLTQQPEETIQTPVIEEQDPVVDDPKEQPLKAVKKTRARRKKKVKAEEQPE